MLVCGPAGIGKTTIVRAAVRGRPHAEGTSLDSLRWKTYLPLSLALGLELAGDPESVASRVTRELGDRVLFVDDLHWADAGTHHVLAMIAGKLPVVATARLGTDLSSLGWDRSTEITVEPLDATASRSLARKLHPDLVDHELDRLLASAGGVPLLLEQLASDGRATPTLRAASAARLARMPDRIRDMVTELAMLRRPVPITMFEVEHGELPAGLVVESDNSVAVVHALIAEAAIESLDTAGRMAAHLRLARRLPDAEAAEHYLAAGEPQLAADAARRSLDEGADPVVRAHVMSVIADATADPRRQVEAAAALVGVGDWTAASRIAEGVESDDPVVCAEAQYHLGRARWFSGDITGACQAVESGLALVGGSGRAIEARLLVELAHQRVRTEHAGRATTEIAEEALAAAERLGVDVPRARLVHATALAHDDRPGWEEGFRDVIRDAADAEDAESECAAAFFLASHYGLRGRAREAIELLDGAIVRAGELRQYTWRTHMRAAELTDRFWAGDEPAQFADDCRRFVDEQPMFRNRAQIELVVALSLADDGRMDEARDGLAAAAALLTSGDDRSMLVAAAAELAWLAGETSECLARVDEGLALGPGYFGILVATVAAGAYAQWESDGKVTVESPAHPAMPVFTTFAREIEALRAASDGDLEEATTAFDAVAGHWAQVGAARFELRARWAAGVIAAQHGHTSARRRLTAVRGDADTRRLWWIRQRAESALASLDGVPALTAREAEVIGLVGDGLTSQAIAERLAISRVTVETHIQAAMRKLGATTRRQAVAILSQRNAG